MKTFILISLILIPYFAKAQLTVQQSQTKLMAYKEDQFAVTKKISLKDVQKKINALNSALAEASQAALSAKQIPNQAFFNQVVKTASFTYDVDPSLAINEHFPSLIKKYPVQMKKAIEALPKNKRAILEEDLRALEVERKSGNG